MAKRVPIPPTPTKRAAIYYRVSGKEQVQGYSLDAQVRAEAWCKAHGWEIVARYPEPGRSARKDDEARRPAFVQMLADAEARRFDVVIVHKLDRLARNRRVAFDAFHRLGSAGVGFVSIAENMDYSTPAGQLMLTMLVGMAQFYSDNLSWETKKGKAERKAQGVYNGLLPFGTTKGPTGLPVLATEALYCDVASRREIVPAEGLRLAFELAAAGQTDREVAQALNRAGYLTSGNRGQNRFTKDSVCVILQNRFYLGELPDGEGGWLPGKHGGMIDPDLFARAERAREANTNRPRRVAGVRSPWALSGIATCGNCGGMVIVTSHPSGNRRLRCAGRAQGNGCDEPSCFAHVVEDQIGDLLKAFAVSPERKDSLMALWRRYADRAPDSRAERAKLERRLARLRDLYLDGDIDKGEYQAQRAKLTDQLATLPTDDDRTGTLGQRLAAFLANLSAAWTVATAEERNQLARQLFSQVVIANRTAVAVVPRPDLRPFFQLVAVDPPEEVAYGGSDGIRTRGLSLDRAAC
ncbi:MAG: site-specific recombinase [Thermomicrobiales bacterium]|nr:site-specific recombinase [Thermomicrobiales bacterium]